MNNNQTLKNIQEILKLKEDKLAEILELSDIKVTPSEMSSWLKSEDTTGHAPLSDKMTALFLNALIYFKRGKDETDSSRPLELPITNNIVLKKIRIAFKLEEKDIASLAKKQNSTTTPKEWSYYFRKEGHKNYRECPDAFLQMIFNGLKLET